ncbi:MAG: c-type cytochrome, partial [Candidatus Thioglobus sp.]|nr:c-type cytochrome [Candidatus Thioglobus sp.]
MNIKMPFIFVIIAAAATVSAAVNDDKLSLYNSVWTEKVHKLATSGDGKKGKKLAKKCSACHGDNGISEDNETPSLAGQKPAYTFKQIYDYQHKIRKNKTMFKKVKKLSYA